MKNLLKIIAIVVFCLVATFIVVWPLWKLATTFPKIYTIISLTLLFALLIFVIIKKIIRKNAK